MQVTARVICLLLAILFFMLAAFNMQPRSMAISWRDLGYASVVIAFLV